MNAADPVSRAMFPAYFPHELVSRARLRSLRRGEVLFGFGDRIDSLHRVVEGQLSLVHLLPDGGELVLPMAEFDRWLIQDGSFARAWAIDLARRLKDQFLRYQRLSLRNARDRILHFLHSEADTRGVVSLPGSYAGWAAEMGLTKETLYRALAALEDEAVLSRDGRQLTILGSPLRRRTCRDR